MPPRRARSGARMEKERMRVPFEPLPRWRKLAGAGRLAARLAFGALTHRRRAAGLEERLAAFPRDTLPLDAPVDIAWNDHQIPIVTAGSDDDLAVALGAVHAHLRHGQMEIMRRIARGRLSEALGPVAVELDATLRIVDFPRAVPAILAAMPAETRRWTERFVAGINAAIAHARRPEELALLGLRPEPWRVEDVVAVSRLAAIDFSWRVWFRLLALRDRPDWTHLWRRIVDARAAPVPSFAGSGETARLIDLIWGSLGRGGSNAAATAARRSATGGALLTSDPHLSLIAPNTWLAAGLRSPGTDIVGLMIPGLPAVTLGRNRHIAWGGTSLHAASSDLFDVTDLPASDFGYRREEIRVRWGRPVALTARETEHGPVITDAPLLRSRGGTRDLAMTWIGHRASDEITAMLGMMRARDWDAFTRAAEGHAAPALTLVFADAKGGVGRAMAAHLPARVDATPEDLVSPPEALSDWDHIVTGRDLPRDYDPPDGVVASANNRPEAATPIPVGFFFSPDERVRRLRAALVGADAVTPQMLRDLHRDVRMPSATAMRDRLLATLAQAGDTAAAEPDAAAPERLPTGPLLAALAAWDGAHDAGSAGALAFELFLFHFLHQLHGADGMALYRASLEPWALLREDLERIPRARVSAAAQAAAAAAAGPFAEHGTWGAIHRLSFAHPLARLPLIGRRYVFADLAAGGSNETLMKTAHGLSGGPHRVAFGANARFLTDMSDPGSSEVVLFGGQDGWLGSSTFADQIDLWQRGATIPLPLDPDTAAATYRHRMRLRPAGEDA